MCTRNTLLKTCQILIQIRCILGLLAAVSLLVFVIVALFRGNSNVSYLMSSLTATKSAFLIIFGLLSFVANVFGLISINSRNIKNITVFALFEFAQCVALLIMSSLSALAEVFALILIYTYITMLKEKKLEEEQVDFYSIPVTIYDTPPAAVTRSTTSGPPRQSARMQSYQPSRPSTSGSHASQAVSSHSLPTYEEAVNMRRLERLELDSDDEAPNNAIVPVAWFDAVSTPKDRRRTGSESNVEIPLNCLQLSEAYKESRLI